MERQYVVFVEGGDPAVARILEGIGSLANVRIEQARNTPPTESPHKPGHCAVCGDPTVEDLLESHGHIAGKICPICNAAAKHLEAQIQEAAKKQFVEFYDQLPRMVRDVRGGAREPIFYQGFE